MLTTHPINGNGLVHSECPNCARPAYNFFCFLAGQERRLFESLKITKKYPRQKILFVQGQPAVGVYILCAGRVKLSTCSPGGKVIILEIAEPGAVLGIIAVLAGTEYSVTAEAIEDCQVNFVQSESFVNYLRQNPEAALSAARQLAHSCHRAQRMICSFGLADSVIVKLSKLFLSWSTNTHAIHGSLRVKNAFTHEDMARMIGSTRETVTRALRQMRERGLVTVKGHEVLIHNHNELCRTAGLKPVDTLPVQ